MGFSEGSRTIPVEKALPVISVLTIAATGSEMDGGGVITNPETNDKLGRIVFTPAPKASFLDPTATYSVSRYQTACGGGGHFEPCNGTVFQYGDRPVYAGLLYGRNDETVIKYAPIAMEQPDNCEARANLMWASSWAINGFINGGKRQAWELPSDGT